MVALTRVYHFSAAHRLENPELSPEANAALYGPCHRLHGHNYYLEVTVAGEPDPLTGMAADLGRLDSTVQEAILEQVDHHRLEEAPVLAAALPETDLRRVTVVETAKNRFDYRGENA